MDKPVWNTPVRGPTPRRPLNLENAGAALWESAVDALVKSILVILFGSLVIGFAGFLWKEMAPSTPPGFTRIPNATDASPTAPRHWSSLFRHHRFLVVFCAVFALNVWGRLRNAAGEETERASRLTRASRHFSQHWFGLIIGNAVGAVIAAMVAVWVQQFTLTRMLFGWWLASAAEGMQPAMHGFLGARTGDALNAWVHWYGDNQLKFTFWLFYLAAIGDDLGIPNFKTLGRWLGRRARQRLKQNGREP